MVKKIVLSVIISFGFYSGTSKAQWKSDSTTNTPVCIASNIQQNPHACTDAANGVIVVWEDFRSGHDWDIYAQKLNVDGIPQWAAGGVNLCTSTANQTSPVICSDGSGGAYVAWKDTRTAGNGTDLYAQHIGSDGSLKYGATGSGVAIAADASPPNNLTICSDGFGSAFVAWEDSRTSIAANSRPDIWMNKLSSGGVSWGGGGASIVSQSLHQTMPKIADDGNGGCYLVWVNSTLPASIWGVRLNSNGSPLWSSPGIQIFEGVSGSSDISRNPGVCRDGNQLCVSWEQYNSSNSSKGWNLLANRIKNDGSFIWGNSTVGSEISTDWTGDQINSVIFSDDSAGTGSNAGVELVYEDLSTGSHDIVMTRLLPDGITLRPPFSGQLFSVCRQSGDQAFPCAVKTGSGELLIVWNDERSNGGSTTFSSIYAQRCDKTPKRFIGPSPANSTWGVPVSNRVNSNADQVVLVPRANGGIAVWRDSRNGNTDIYAQLIFRDASLPIDLSSFSISLESKGTVLLDWTTTNEKDNAGFEVERRLISDPNAANTFEVIGSYLNNTSLSGAGNSGTSHNYSFIDQPGKPGVYEYRIADVSLDGERATHEPKTVELSSTSFVQGFSVGQNIPNPFNDRTIIPVNLSQPAQVEIAITDVLGRAVSTTINSLFESGSHSLTLNPQTSGMQLSPGAYYYSVTIRDPQTNSILWRSPKAALMIKISN